MKTSDFYYELPEELIAQHPLSDRSSSRLMTLDGSTGAVSHMHFSDLPYLLHKGDVLVINNTKVIPARLLGSRSDTGSAVELLLLKRIDENHWETLARPGKKIRPGKRMTFLPGKLEAECEEVQLEDQTRYQTVYAKETGSAAAPTAGLHFTPELLGKLREMGVEICEVTLHVGLGTFRPVKVDDISDHHMHSEWYELDEKASSTLRKARREGRRVIAVGTTSCRTLETVAAKDPGMHPCSGWTDIFIYPGVDFRCIDGLITNFHLPESTLIMLVSAFAGKEHVLNAYKTAVSEKYRFFSFGDAMFITPEKPRIKSPLEDQE